LKKFILSTVLSVLFGDYYGESSLGDPGSV